MKFVIVGGGIAGVSCAFSLLKSIGQDDNVVLISASEHVKTVANWTRVGQFAEFFTVSKERLFVDDSRFRFVNSSVSSWNNAEKLLQLENGPSETYDRLCIATGATPRCPWNEPRVTVLRDSDSASKLQEKLASAKRVTIVGNGGIATELVYELKDVEISWIMRDPYPSAVFLLPQVSRFMENRMVKGRLEGSKTSGIVKRSIFSVKDSGSSRKERGCALGPDWNTSVNLEGVAENHSVDFYPSDEVSDVEFGHRVTVSLASGGSIECDLIVWATGVDPNSGLWKNSHPQLTVAEDGGILVDEQLKTSVEDVFACGDVCSVDWPSSSDSWKQMKLWTQARQMGDYCARSMISNGDVELDFCFEIFAHVTTFCGFKVVLLGDYKGERQPPGWYVRERVVGEDEYVCCVMFNHRVVGATLIGNTQLDETIENLILNSTDISQIEEHFLDPGIDIEDYFD